MSQTTRHVSKRCKVCSHFDQMQHKIYIMSQSLLSKLSVIHRAWSTFYFVLSAPTLFMLVKLLTVLGLELTITNTALNTIYQVTP